jgi:hypothetical protein
MSPIDDSPESQDTNLSGEAIPQEVAPVALPPVPAFGLHDSSWTDDQWADLLRELIASGIANWKDIAALVLGHLNPSQVGTSLASSEGFKRRYGKGNTMRIVMEWVYQQNGRCADCGTRLELQADHMKGREQFEDPLDADFIENMTLRCRRCNVVRRPSHEFGGLTFLTAESALMWILMVIRPRTRLDYIRMCRVYGMTMSDIRMQEAWAMAHWLARDNPPAFGVEKDEVSTYDLLIWNDSAITRVDSGADIPANSTRLYAAVPGNARLGFLTLQEGRLKFHEQPMSYIPFSSYDLGARPPQALCILYAPPDRENAAPQRISSLAPRDSELVAHAVALLEQKFQLYSDAHPENAADLPDAPPYGKLVRTRLEPPDCKLRVVPA